MNLTFILQKSGDFTGWGHLRILLFYTSLKSALGHVRVLVHFAHLCLAVCNSHASPSLHFLRNGLRMKQKECN